MNVVFLLSMPKDIKRSNSKKEFIFKLAVKQFAYEMKNKKKR